MQILRRFKGKAGFWAVRRWMQFLSLAIVCFIGIRFGQFVSSLENGMLPAVQRPAGVEAFLPISALVSLKYYILTGVLNDAHPSALILFLIICVTALWVRKGFCSYICPFGLLSEYLLVLHRRIFNQAVRLPAGLDHVLRAIKYVLAGFFIYFVFFRMSLPVIEGFLQSPYYILADIHMYRFFAHISPRAFGIISGFVLMTVLIPNFWCRYICPYGALLGVISIASVGRIKFDPSQCRGCGKCESTCPAYIPIRQGKASVSLECSACFQCVEACPEKKALQYSFPGQRNSMGNHGVALILLSLFIFGITLARSADHWHSKIPEKMLLYYVMSEGINRETNP